MTKDSRRAPEKHKPGWHPQRALISVSDKTGLTEMAQALVEAGVEIISTGGTAAMLSEAGISCTEVAAITGAAEMMDGRVKTLHPMIHGGILARRDNPAHLQAMTEHDITPISLVIVNLYPFEKALKNADADHEMLIENIDIGGPAMIRAAAKNHDFVAVVTDPGDYPRIISELQQEGGISVATRRRLATTAFAHTAHYDSTIAEWMRQTAVSAGEIEPITPQLGFSGRRLATLRYGENPHQKAGLYQLSQRQPRAGVLTARQLQGKPLSYNNCNDADAAFELVAEFTEPACAIIKHANPCGVAQHADPLVAWQQALACDPVSAFGGIIALNRPLTASLAAEISKVFTEVVIAPDAEEDAIRLMAGKPNLRLLLTGGMPAAAEAALQFRSIAGGLLVQERDNGQLNPEALRCVTRRQPDQQETEDMLFAWKVAKHVKSNAIIYARNGATLGIGAGQMSRLDSSRIAARKAADRADAAEEKQEKPLQPGTAVASDAFFPFADGLLAAAEAGATAVIQPGGSLRDEEVIAAADEAGLAMLFTDMRHFRH